MNSLPPLSWSPHLDRTKREVLALYIIKKALGVLLHCGGTHGSAGFGRCRVLYEASITITLIQYEINLLVGVRSVIYTQVSSKQGADASIKMHILLKEVIKEWVPPVMLRWWKVGSQNNGECGRPSISVGGVRLPTGQKFNIRDSVADRDVIRQIFLDREYSVAGFAMAAKLSTFYDACKTPLIIDAGANIGAASVWFAITYPKATVLAVEPDRGNFDLLKENTKDFPSIFPINAAIASVAGTLHLTDPGQGAWGYRTSSGPSDMPSYPVPAVTIEDLIEKGESKTPFLLKIDIEGAEVDLFSRASPLFHDFPLIAIELHDWMMPGVASSQNFLKWHVARSRDLVFRGENAFSFAI